VLLTDAPSTHGNATLRFYQWSEPDTIAWIFFSHSPIESSTSRVAIVLYRPSTIRRRRDFARSRAHLQLRAGRPATPLHAADAPSPYTTPVHAGIHLSALTQSVRINRHHFHFPRSPPSVAAIKSRLKTPDGPLFLSVSNASRRATVVFHPRPSRFQLTVNPPVIRHGKVLGRRTAGAIAGRSFSTGALLAWKKSTSCYPSRTRRF